MGGFKLILKLTMFKHVYLIDFYHLCNTHSITIARLYISLALLQLLFKVAFTIDNFYLKLHSPLATLELLFKVAFTISNLEELLFKDTFTIGNLAKIPNKKNSHTISNFNCKTVHHQLYFLTSHAFLTSNA